jgi:hypothetical protein
MSSPDELTVQRALLGKITIRVAAVQWAARWMTPTL